MALVATASPVHNPETLDHHRAPLLDALLDARRRDLVAFSTPGHKGGPGADPALVDLVGADVFASDVWLNTAVLAERSREAEALAADALRADHGHFLVNGSSSGNQAFLLAMLRPGDEVVVGRDIHTSFLTALILSGARPVYVTPRFHPEHDVSLGVAADDVAAALDAHPSARLVALVSPNYFGIAADLPAIVAVAHRRGVPVYVDEAWGAHFAFHPALPPSAMDSDADAAVTSVHKLLGSLSQGALLMLQGGRIDAGRVSCAVSMTQTTSPLLPLLASIDASRRQMALTGRSMLDQAIELAAIAHRRLAALPGIDLLDGRKLGLSRVDPTRLVIDVHGTGLSGYQVERLLRERFDVVPEMSDATSVVCLVTVGDSPASIDRLVDAFRRVTAGRPARHRRIPGNGSGALGEIIAPGPLVLSPRDAYHAPSRAVPLAEAAGQIAAELVVPYPPGIPLLAPGERIGRDKVDWLAAGLAAGLSVRCASDRSLATIRVVAGA